MESLRQKLFQSSRFLIGAELVSVRGSMGERNAIKARAFANDLVACRQVDWVSITDNAGGNPQLAPTALGKPILYAGKEVVIHLTCKDLNRNGLESEAWLLNSEGYHNILAMTGDYPNTGNEGLAKPVFDIDSVGLIAMLDKMNHGFASRDERNGSSKSPLGETQFCIGAVTTNFKLLEGEVMPQYLKLAKKIECGARFIINQIGFDSRKMAELRRYMIERGMQGTPLIGNVYLLNARVAEVFHRGRIPGVVLTKPLLEICERQGRSPDGGKAFFREFAARQLAIYRGLGYRGAYLGGVHDIESVEEILAIEKTFGADDWKEFARDFAFSRPGEFFYYGTEAHDPNENGSAARNGMSSQTRRHGGVNYQLLKWTHDAMFSRGGRLASLGAKICNGSTDSKQGPKAMRALEMLSKSVMFHCRDCGDCSLPDIAFLCPESQCAKNQRNGPCGGTRGGKCEVDGYGDCIWLRAYERLKQDGREQHLLDHAPVVQNQALRGTSAWANFWLGRDHASKKQNQQAKGVNGNHSETI